MSAVDMEAVTAQRETLLENGWTALPLDEKQCFLAGWPRLLVNRHEVRRWRRLLRYKGTGIRLDNGLCAIDIDINHAEAVSAILKRLEELLPGSLLLVRHGNGAKVAVFVRTDEPFGRISTRRWIKPGETEEDGAHGVEIFGGGSARYFGAYGRCGPGTSYRWARRSPIDTRLEQLPVYTKRQFFAAIDAAEEVLRQANWQVVERSKGGENASRPVHDLTDDMRFECSDGATRTLADLKELARVGAIHDLRCSASWLEGPSARRTDRCTVNATKNGCLTIWETSSGVTHMPTPIEFDMSAVNDRLRRIGVLK